VAQKPFYKQPYSCIRRAEEWKSLHKAMSYEHNPLEHHVSAGKIKKTKQNTSRLQQQRVY